MDETQHKKYIQQLEDDNQLKWLEMERYRIYTLSTPTVTMKYGEEGVVWGLGVKMRLQEIERQIKYRREQIRKHYER